MSESDELELFVMERLLAYDPNTRLDPQSPAVIEVVNPIVNRFTPDPIDNDPELFAKTRLMQEYPNLAVGEGSMLSDIIKAFTLLHEPFRREIRSIRRNQSLVDPTILNKDEADSLISNIFIKRNLGDYARLKVRLYFENAMSANIGSTNIAFTQDNKRFLPVRAQSITSEAMLFNTEGSYYYFDVDYIAESVGKSYNVDVDEITGVLNLPSAVKAVNLTKAQYGSDEETTVEMIARGEQSIGERSLATLPGIVAKLFESFTSLQVLNVIGFNDTEMQRDVLTGGNLGDNILSSQNGSTSDDGDGDGYTPYLDDSTVDFTTTFGPIGTDLSGYVLTTWISGSPEDFNLSQVLGATQIEISDEYSGDDRMAESGSFSWQIRKKTLTLSNIPGGILFPDLGESTIDVEDNQVHIGGCTDIYVNGTELETTTQVVELYGTDNPSKKGYTAATTNGSNIITITSVTQDDFLLVTPGKTTIRKLTAPDSGTYRVISGSYAAGTMYLEVDFTFTADSTGSTYDLINSIDMDLVSVREVVTSDTDLRTYAGNNVVDTGGGTIWADKGVDTSHYLEIINGDDAGEYDIQTVSGQLLTLATTMSQTADPLQYRILKRQDANIQLPLIRIKTIELLDSSLEPTGDFVPYKHPVDTRSSSFQNPGRGSKAGTDNITTDDTVAVDIGVNDKLLTSSEAINYYDLGVRPGDLVNILTGDNIGYYVVDVVGGSVGAGIADNALTMTTSLRWTDATMSYTLGEPSYGSFRVYFLEPVDFVVTYENTLFTTGTGVAERRFRPDPEVRDELLPTSITVPTVMLTATDAEVELYTPEAAAEINPKMYDVQAGDRVEITFAPIVGSEDLSSGTVALTNKSILLDLGSGAERVTFLDSLSLDDIITQVNIQTSRDVADKYIDGGAEYFTIRSDQEVTLMDNSAAGANDATADIFGTTPVTYNPWLAAVPAFAGQIISNDSPEKSTGYLYVNDLTSNSLILEDDTGAAFNPTYTLVDTELAHYAIVTRAGQQRISSTEMNDQRDDLGLYYFDVECVSEGYGDTWNISADVQGTLTGYDSEGWEVTVEDENTSYSMAEDVWVHITPRVLFAGTDSDPSNKTELVGQSFQITYERSDLVEQIHTYVRDNQNRVVCQSPLVKSLLPVFIRTSIVYSEGAEESDVRSDIVDIIDAVLPEAQLQVSDIQKAVTDLGATYVQTPIEIIGVIHGTDRAISLDRSKDAITAERLSVMISDDDDTVEGASWIQLARN